MKQFDQVKEFMTIAGQGKLNLELRKSLILEEAKEFSDATNQIDRIDAIGDVMVVAIGGAVEEGLTKAQLVAVIDEIMASNMSKFLTDEHGDKVAVFNEIGKVEKGPHYYKPNLKAAINRSAGEDGLIVT